MQIAKWQTIIIQNWEQHVRRTTKTLSDTGPASFNDRKEKGEVTQRQHEGGGGGGGGGEEGGIGGGASKWEGGKGCICSTNALLYVLPLLLFLQSPKNKAHGSCSGTLPTQSICLPPSSFSWRKNPRLAAIQPFKTTQKSTKCIQVHRGAVC